ncbi:MAG: RHS repeat-associated core domain-containing protein [Deltaproteobacteria bacterium]|nr:RHS repeat-associated core domain-containing protein [Deltaproteobacteria bacterium]
MHGRCGDPDENEIPLDCRSGGGLGGLGGLGDEEKGGGTDDPEEAVDLSCAYSCATEQHFTYAWDEVNRIAHARRLDREDGGDWELAVEQRYLYDASNQRTVKTTTFRGIESGTERSALYVYPGDFERRGLVKSRSGTTYEAVAGDTETQYGVGGARIVWRTSDRDETLDRDQRITLSLTDLIQSTTAVIDLATGELVEAGSYYANGARETYRSNETETVTPEVSGFTGKEADEEVGLTYFGHRYLMAHLGRWTSPDPLQTHQVDGGEALNGYHYVSGNLLQARDPLGLKSASSGPITSTGSKQIAQAQQGNVEARLAADARFAALPRDGTVRAAVLQRAHQGADLEEILAAATWRPAGPQSGVRITLARADDLLTVVQTAMVLDPNFHAAVVAQDANGANPIQMAVPDGAPRVAVDSARALAGGARQRDWGYHTVDIRDVMAFDSATDPNRARPNGTSREQNVVHFMIEAIAEVQITGGGRPPRGTQAQQDAAQAIFDRAHAEGIRVENIFRRAVGQQGDLLQRIFPRSPGCGQDGFCSRTGRLVYEGFRETWHLTTGGDFRSVN